MNLKSQIKASEKSGALVVCRLFFADFQDDAGGAEGEESAIINEAAFAWCQFHIVDEGTSIAVVVAKGIAQTSFLVATHSERAMVEVDAGINSLEGGVDGVAFLIAAYDVVAHLQGNGLLIVEHVFDDRDATVLAVGY